MGRLYYFAVTVLVFIVLSYGPITRNRLTVSLWLPNNVYRRILKLPPRSSASTMYAINTIDSFEILIRKRIFGFTESLNKCENTMH